MARETVRDLTAKLHTDTHLKATDDPIVKAALAAVVATFAPVQPILPAGTPGTEMAAAAKEIQGHGGVMLDLIDPMNPLVVIASPDGKTFVSIPLPHTRLQVVAP
jgi:hypothetical protein